MRELSSSGPSASSSQSAANDSTFKPALMLMSGRAMAFAVTFFVPVLLARLFAPEEFGTYKQFILITYTLYNIGQLGLSECLFYFLPNNPAGGGRYVFNSMLTLFIAGALCFAGLMAIPARIALWLNNPALVRYVPLIGIYLIPMLMATLLEITMISRKRYHLATATYVTSDILRAALLLIPAFLTRSLEWALIGGILFFSIRVLGEFVYFRREFKSDLRFDAGLLQQQLAYALPFALAVVVDIIQSNYHQYAVSSHFDPATFAIYSIGCLQIPLVDFMATPASNVMMVRMGEEMREGRAGHLLPIWHDTTRKLALVFFPMVGLLVVNAYQLITFLFTKTYAASVPVFTVWSLSILFSAFQTDGVMRVFAQTRFLVAINIARLFAIALLMNWFLSTFFLAGAVLVTLIGISVAKTMALVRMKSLMRASFAGLLPWKNLGGTLIVAMLAALPPVILNAKLSLPALYLLPICGVAYMITYCTLVLSCGLLTEGEKQALRFSVAAVIDRRRFLGLKTVGGHRPPLQ